VIIDITKSGYRKGYLPREGVGVFHPFFATANAAFRRDALLEVGGFDPRCATGEDIDLSIRIAASGRELWFEPSARVTHHHRSTLRGLLRQWFGYGLGHAYLFRKHSPRRRLELYRYDLSAANPSPFGIRRVASLPSPVHGMVFLSSYHGMHAGAALAAGAFLGGWTAAGWLLTAGAAACAAWYFGIRFDPRRPARSVALSGIRWIADAAYVLGGLLGGLREGVLYLEATRTRRRPRQGSGRHPDAGPGASDGSRRTAAAARGPSRVGRASGGSVTASGGSVTAPGRRPSWPSPRGGILAPLQGFAGRNRPRRPGV
jgi:hypothetical protein